MEKVNLKKRIILVAICAALIFIFWHSAFIQEKYGELITLFESQIADNPILSIFIFLSLTVMSVMFFFFSSVFVVPIAVSVWGSFTTTMFLLLGWILGAIFSYLIGRFAGHPILKHFIPEKKLDYYRNFLEENSGLLSIFLLRFTFPSEIPGYVLGIIKLNFLRYMFVTILAEIPYAFVTVYAFNAILNRDPLVLGLIVSVWFLAAAILTRILYKKSRNKK